MSLIKEFAIEPEVMAQWEHFNLLWEDFGADKGRLIARYPIQWKRRVQELAQISSKPVRAKSIAENIGRDDYKFLDAGRCYSSQKDWIDNATSQPSSQPFHAIITKSCPKFAPDNIILVDSDGFEKDKPPYKVDHQSKTPRDAKELAECASLLLRYCSTLKLVDPYFDPSEPRFSNVFRDFISRCNRGNLKIIEIHLRTPQDYKQDIQYWKYKHFLSDIVPEGMILHVFFWKQKQGGIDMHERLLLTEIAGILYDHGLDEGENGEMTHVSTISHESYMSYSNIYRNKSDSFEMIDHLIISGVA